MADEKTCPHCGKPVPPTALGGICPECMLKAGLAAQTEGPGAIGPQGTKVVQPPPSPAEIASLFPQLEILECLGRGGMGVVYKARQPRLNRLVALKILARDKEQDGQFAERFTREAQTLARLNHPNIVTVHDFGEAGGHCYLVMEFVDGLNLRQLLLAGKMRPDQALTIVPMICEALQYAHEQGVVHRDIKPENILLEKSGRVKIADFGIAKMLGVGAGHQALTGAKDVMGTPHYMAPEQVEKPLTVDHRADIYSLGVVFYEMLTGELPLGKFAPPSKKVQIDVRLDEVVLHTLEKEPERRYQQASQLKTDVETIAGTPPTAGFGAKGDPTPLLATPSGKATSDKIILPALLLAFPFGVFGAHRFYVGKIGTAFLQLATLGGCILLIIACATLGPLGQPVTGILLGFLIFGCFIWATIDWILILCKAFTDGQGRRITNWFHPQTGEMKTGVTPLTGSPSTPPPGGTAPPAAAPPPAPMAQEKTPAKGTGKIVAPAAGLMVAGMLKLFSALTALFVLASPGASWLGKLLDNVGAGSLSHWGVLAGFSIVLLKVVPACLILFGGLQMVQLRSYAWAVAAGILAIVCCSLVGFPVGIWALIILARQDVRETFANAAVSQSPKTGNKWPWVLGSAAVAGVIVIGLIIAVVLALRSIDGNPNVNVRGTVTDAITGKPIAGARVDDNRYGADTDKAPQQAWTDKQGHYNLKTWYEEHTLAASAPGYEPSLNTLFTKVLDSEREKRMDFKLRPAGKNAPTPESEAPATPTSGPVIEHAKSKNAYSASPVTRGELSQVITASGTLNPVSSDPEKWRIVSPVAEADIAMVEAGQNIAFTVDAFSNRRFTGSVLQISNAPTTMENTVAYETTLAVNDPDPKFRPGMTANISITVAHRDAVLRIPNAALRFRPPGSTSANRERGPERTVYVLAGGNESTPEPVQIKTGITDGSLTEVTEGLKEGDRVVTGLTSLPPAAQPAANANPGPATLSEPYAHRTKIIGDLVTTDEFQQDFNQTLPLTANGRLTLDNINGRIEIAGWDRNEVVIKALKHGKTRESIEATKITVNSSPDEIVIHTEQPSGSTSFSSIWSWFNNDKRNAATVDYAIQVPQNARLKNISSVNGRIVIEDVSGDIKASTVNGETQVKDATGGLKLSTVNGRIEAELTSLGGSQSVSFSTVNGHIEATLPANANAEVSASTVNGGISSEFPSLVVKKEFPLGRHLKGALGSGGASVKASTVNGGISFRRGKETP